MTHAHFQPLTWRTWYRLTGWMVGIIRVYTPNMSYPSSPYKFFTVAVLQNAVATIHGMHESRIKLSDLHAIEHLLSTLKIKTATWTHNNKTTIHKIPTTRT